jgi:hypothetical protein
MKAIVTYCSAQKNTSRGLLPAIDRYCSERIARVAKLAEEKELAFFILSGKYGFVAQDELISYYDHLLVESEVDAHSKIVSAQLKFHGIREIEFHMNHLKDEAALLAYLDCMKKACEQCGVKLNVIETLYFD